MGERCTTCDEPFDKNDIEMVSTWHVAVRPEQEKVNLYCPPCWDGAQEMIADFRQRIEEKQND